MDEVIKMPLGMRTRGSPGNHAFCFYISGFTLLTVYLYFVFLYLAAFRGTRVLLLFLHVLILCVFSGLLK